MDLLLKKILKLLFFISIGLSGTEDLFSGGRTAGIEHSTAFFCVDLDSLHRDSLKERHPTIFKKMLWC